MGRMSITERHDRLARRGNEMDEGAAPAELIVAPSEVHRVTVEVLTDLLNIGERLSNGNTPPHLKILMRTMQKSRPMLLEGLTNIPPEAIQGFMAELGAKILTIANTPLSTPEGTPVDADRAVEPGADIA